MDLAVRGAVKVVVNLFPLGELPLRELLLERRAGEEVVIDAVGLAGAHRPRRRRDRELHPGMAPEDLPCDGGLAAAARARHDDELRRPHERYSMFASCSRIFSSSSLTPTMRWAVEASFAFDPIVFASRFISWTRNVSFRPAASSSPRALRKNLLWLRNRTHSSVMSSRSA